MKDDTYYFHQTPNDLAKDLICMCPLKEGDTVLEPFRGEGSFYNNFPTFVNKEWCEIEDGRDYTSHTKHVDWVITNPPFKIDNKNTIYNLLEHFSHIATKGIGFLANDRFISTLTPKRLNELQQRGWFVHNICVVNVKAWRGRYFFIVFRKEPNYMYKFLLKTYV